jgi:hypothetical protein
MHASGAFDVKLNQESVDASGTVSRLSIVKQFQGDLNGASQGEMLAAGTSVQGSAGYVAIERVTASLQGRNGTFVLQHSGIMNRGAPHLIVIVVPDSGTDQLAGLSGTMVINIVDGKHFYEFEYTLPQT